MFQVAGGIILAVLFFCALPYLLEALGRVIPWVIGGAAVLIALGGAASLITYWIENPDEFISGLFFIGQLILGLIVLGGALCAMAFAGSKLPPESPNETNPE